MVRSPAFAIAALSGLLLLAGCGAFGQAGLSVPHSGDGVQTVSDAADSLDAHRSLATENAKAAIAVTDALGSVMRDVGGDERFLSLVRGPLTKGATVELHDRLDSGARQVSSISQLVIRPGLGNVSAYCQSSAGYSVKGIPSLDETFGWQNGAFAGGTRVADGRTFSTWSANASGVAVQAPIGGLSIVRTPNASCPMMTPTFSLKGAKAIDAFSIPFTLTYRHGTLWNLSISNAEFSDGESLYVATSFDRQPTINGTITKGNTELATFRADSRGNGGLTVTSTGAQYVVSDWIVTGI
jgi:hypothetical protein